MASIELYGVSVNFDMPGVKVRSLRNDLVKTLVGGKLYKTSDHIVVSALSNVSFSAKAGDRIGLIGLNGSGKSTLLKTMAGIYPPTNGVLRREGRTIALIDLMMGMDSEQTGAQCIMSRAIFLGMTYKQSRDLLSELAEFTELGNFLHMPIRTYSAGMLLRLGFAVSTALPSDILIMDEMINVGDATFLEKAQKRMTAVIEAASILFLASHDFGSIRSFCNKAIYMNAGSMVMFDEVENVLDRYWSDLKTAGLV